MGCVSLPRISPGADGGRDLRRSEGPGYCAAPPVKKTACGTCGRVQRGWYDRKVRQVRNLSSGDTRVYLDVEVRRISCGRCGTVKQERLAFLADNPFYTKRFAFYVGRRCRETHHQGRRRGAAPRLAYRQGTGQAVHAGATPPGGLPGPRVIGIDEIAVASATATASWSATWSGGARSGSAARTAPRRAWTSSSPGSARRNAARSAWPSWTCGRPSANPPQGGHAPQAQILYDKFHVLSHLGEAMDEVPQAGVRPALGEGPPVHQGAEVHLLSRWENLTTGGQAGAEAAVPGQPAAEQGLPAEGVVRPALGLPTPGLGAPVLRQLERRLEVATPGALSQVRRDGRAPLGRYRGVLPRENKVASGLRGRPQQQDPRPPASGLRLPGRGVLGLLGMFGTPLGDPLS